MFENDLTNLLQLTYRGSDRVQVGAYYLLCELGLAYAHQHPTLKQLLVSGNYLLCELDLSNTHWC